MRLDEIKRQRASNAVRKYLQDAPSPPSAAPARSSIFRDAILSKLAAPKEIAEDISPVQEEASPAAPPVDLTPLRDALVEATEALRAMKPDRRSVVFECGPPKKQKVNRRQIRFEPKR